MSEEQDEDKINKNTEILNDYQLQHKYLFRVCLLGDAGVGKSSLLTRFCDSSFKENYNCTIGVDFRLVTLKYNDIISKIHIWDTAGQERFKALTANYFHCARGFIFIYDITNKESFENITKWINLAYEKNKDSVFNILVGNKCDKNEQREVDQNEANNLAKEKNLYFLESSAKND